MREQDKARQWWKSPSERRSFLTGILLISPWLLGFLTFTTYPMFASLYYSFTRYDLIRPPVFNGLFNFQQIFREPVFRQVIQNTLVYVGIGVPMALFAAFLMANLLNTRIFGRSFFRAIFFFPAIMPAVVIALIWSFLLNPQWGAVNTVIKSMGLKAIPFLSSPLLAKPTLIAIGMWASGYSIVIYLATLQDVPRELYEAATVDGANAWHKFWNVTLPFCTPVILFTLVTGFIGGLQDFTLPWVLTGGGPNSSTEFYALFLYRNAFKYMSMGRASALAWMLFIVVVAFTIVLFRSSARWVYYGGGEE